MIGPTAAEQDMRIRLTTARELVRVLATVLTARANHFSEERIEDAIWLGDWANDALNEIARPEEPSGVRGSQ